ncbi:hypothetical protein E4N62_45340 [Streptomyces sp. MNU76]|uniref:hypothetical protein n=1 Tax=Streptomyces sp. MNU76 TaxID=2560026 RepID=UPI001E439241|nr:hypothetical protein [Streptomyces sp. MNU76]MCC9711811.1 hypothetical protein [Streptomyces sp. MNU76]
MEYVKRFAAEKSKHRPVAQRLRKDLPDGLMNGEAVATTQYRPVNVRLRAPRLALAYYTLDSWIPMARGAVAAASRVWGGAAAVVLPVHGMPSAQATVADVLLPLLRLHDPDHIALLQLALSDLAVVDPSVVDTMVARFGGQDEDTDTVWQRLSPMPLPAPGAEGLAAQVNDWCTPFKSVVRHAQQRFEAGDVLHVEHGGTSRGRLATVPTLPGKPLLTLDLAGVDPALALMVESRIGAVHPHARDALDIVELPVEEEDLPALVHLAITGRPATGWRLASRYRSATGGGPSDTLTADEFMACVPFTRSEAWTKRLTRIDTSSPIVWVVGDTADDHALAQLCDRLYQQSVWMPSRLLANNHPLVRAVRGALWSFYSVGDQHRPPILLTSVSLSPEDLQNLATELNAPFTGMTMRVGDGPQVPFNVRKAEAVTPAALAGYQGIALLADPEARRISQRVPTSRENGSTSLLTSLQLPEPQAAAHLGADLHWYVDVWLPDHNLPAHAALPGSCLVQETNGFPETIARTARHSVSFISANMGFATPEDRHTRPLLHFPSADRVFEELARAHDATVERSDAGLRAAIAAEMWGSPEALAADLRGPARKVLDSFLPTGKKRDGDYGAGYAIRGIGYVALEDIEKTLGDSTFGPARDLVDRLLTTNVLRRGLILNCARCRFEAFYRIEQVGAAFDCEACGHTSPLVRGRWYSNDPEPHWYYSLDQVVRDLLLQNGDVPLLATRLLQQNTMSVLWSPELKITDAEGAIELDLCLIIDGRIVIGEAKSNNTLKARKGTREAAARLVHAAQLLSANEIVLATSARAWAKDTISTVTQAIEDSWTKGPRPTVTELIDVRSRH